MFNLGWKIFSRDEILEMMKIAKSHGLHTDNMFPAAKEGVCRRYGKEYTFISIVFSKE